MAIMRNGGQSSNIEKDNMSRDNSDLSLGKAGSPSSSGVATETPYGRASGVESGFKKLGKVPLESGGM